jgi:hypothetical protein
MKNYLFCFVLALTACSSTTNKNINTDRLENRKISTDFVDEGVIVHYTIFGKLEKIEVFGQADAWKGNVETLADADAYAKLVKFIYGNDVNTNRRVMIIGKAIEQAKDQSRIDSPQDLLQTNDKQIEQAIARDGAPNERSNSSLRSAKILNETVSETLTTITSKGKLVGVRKIRDFQRNDGKLYVAVYQWSEKDQATVDNVREQMNRK